MCGVPTVQAEGYQVLDALNNSQAWPAQDREFRRRMRVAVSRGFRLAALIGLVLAAGCARMPDTGKTSLRFAVFGEMQGYLLSHKADVNLFRLRGPFEVAVQEDFSLRLPAGELIRGDLYLAGHPDKAPLVILLHGYGNSKDDHAYQAMHLASWGMHALSVQLPNTGPWIANGRTLARIAEAVSRQPDLIDPRIDPRRIVLVGHSFGGAAVAIALAEGAPVVGGILLDPAAVGRGFPAAFAKVKKPVLLLGADEEISLARNRDFFYRYIPTGVTEVSIKDAVHEDAQFPLEENPATQASQLTFVSALTAGAISVAATGSFDYAWASLTDGLSGGRFLNAKRK
jgi:pimeloyl-ACP methyl ester carboxylesterase